MYVDVFSFFGGDVLGFAFYLVLFCRGSTR